MTLKFFGLFIDCSNMDNIAKIDPVDVWRIGEIFQIHLIWKVISEVVRVGIRCGH